MFYTYIIRSIPHPECRYIGFTSDLKRRLAEHNSGHVAHTAPLCPWKMEAYIAFEDEQKARAFETYLKSGSGRAFASRHF
jgi:predicted GIY-YIG superfamily endonuclease